MLKVLFFLVVVKKRGEFLRPIKKVMVAEAPNGTPPSFLLYYDIVCIFLYRMYSLNNGFLFFGNIVGLVWV